MFSLLWGKNLFIMVKVGCYIQQSLTVKIKIKSYCYFDKTIFRQLYQYSFLYLTWMYLTSLSCLCLSLSVSLCFSLSLSPSLSMCGCMQVEFSTSIEKWYWVNEKILILRNNDDIHSGCHVKWKNKHASTFQ